MSTTQSGVLETTALPNVIEGLRGFQPRPRGVAEILQALPAPPFAKFNGADLPRRPREVHYKFARIFPRFDGLDGSQMGNCRDRCNSIGGNVFDLRTHRPVDSDFMPSVLTEKNLLKSFLTGWDYDRINLGCVHPTASRLHRSEERRVGKEG